METIKVEGAELASLTLGDARSPPLVMLHGLVSGSMASWYSGIAAPLAATQRVLLYDQRGHGGSSLATGGFDLDHQANDLEQVLRHYQLAAGAVDLVGHSMGALIALHFALRAPHRVRRLVLIDAPMPACDFVAPSLRGVTSREALAQYIETQLTPGLRGRRRERLQQRLAALFFESSLLQDVLAMTAEADAELAELNVPVLLLYGRDSPCLAAGRHLHATLPQAELQLLDGGHFLLEDAPEQVSAELLRFLADAPPESPRSHISNSIPVPMSGNAAP